MCWCALYHLSEFATHTNRFGVVPSASPAPLPSHPFTCPSAFAGVASHLTFSGHHRAACSRTRALGEEWVFLECAIARICREAGGRVTNMLVRDMDLGVPCAGDGRRLEVVVDGLPLHGGVRFALDTTLVSSVRAHGEPRRGVANIDGVAMHQARSAKRRRTPNSWAQGPEHVWSSWRWRLGAGGPQKQSFSLGN